MDYKGCVVVQGGIENASYISDIKKCWKGYQIIFSTWKNTPMEWFDSDDIVLYNQKPRNSGVQNFYYQKVSTICGLEKAKELGWERALKWRVDFISKGDLHSLFGDGLNLYMWVNDSSGYITDFFMEGNIDDLITIFDTEQQPHRFNHPEFAFTLKMYKSGLDKKVKFVGKLLDGDIDVYWHKLGYWFSENTKLSIYLDKLPTFDEWCPMHPTKQRRLF